MDYDVTVVSDGSRVTPGAIINGPAHQVARSAGPNRPSVYARLDKVATTMAVHAEYVDAVLKTVNRHTHHYVWLNMSGADLNIKGSQHDNAPPEWTLAVMRSGRHKNVPPAAHLNHMTLHVLAYPDADDTGSITLFTDDAMSLRGLTSRRVTTSEHQVTHATKGWQHFNMNLDNDGPMWYPATSAGTDEGT